MDNIIKIMESLGKSSLLIDGDTETVKHHKKIRGVSWSYHIAPLFASLIAPVSSLLVNTIIRRGARSAGKG